MALADRGARARRGSRRPRSGGPPAWRSRSRRRSTGGSTAAIAARAALLGGRGRPVHQHVDVRPHQPRRGDQHEHGDEERGERVALLPARGSPRPGRASTASVPGQVAAEVERVRAQRRALVAPRGAERDDRARRVDRDHRRRRPRTPTRPRSTSTLDPAARAGATASAATPTLTSARKPASASAARCSALPCPYGCACVRGPHRDADGEERQAARRRGRCRSGAPRRRGRASRCRSPAASLIAISSEAATTETSAVRRCGLIVRRLERPGEDVLRRRGVQDAGAAGQRDPAAPSCSGRRRRAPAAPARAAGAARRAGAAHRRGRRGSSARRGSARAMPGSASSGTPARGRARRERAALRRARPTPRADRSAPRARAGTSATAAGRRAVAVSAASALGVSSEKNQSPGRRPART